MYESGLAPLPSTSKTDNCPRYLTPSKAGSPKPPTRVHSDTLQLSGDFEWQSYRADGALKFDANRKLLRQVLLWLYCCGLRRSISTPCIRNANDFPDRSSLRDRPRGRVKSRLWQASQNTADVVGDRSPNAAIHTHFWYLRTLSC